MKVIVCKTKEEASAKACEIMTGIVKANPQSCVANTKIAFVIFVKERSELATSNQIE